MCCGDHFSRFFDTCSRNFRIKIIHFGYSHIQHKYLMDLHFTLKVNCWINQTNCKLQMQRKTCFCFSFKLYNYIIWNIPYSQSSVKHPVIWLSGHSVIWSSSHLVIQSFNYPVIRSAGHPCILSSCHSVILVILIFVSTLLRTN